MTHLRQRSTGQAPVTYVSVGVRGELAAVIVRDARAYAKARGVTFGSLLMEALDHYIAAQMLEAQENAAEAAERG